VVEAAVRIPLIYVSPIGIMVGLSMVLQIAALVLLITWNMWHGRRMRARNQDAAGIT
jgi:hypothetical protein